MRTVTGDQVDGTRLPRPRRWFWVAMRWKVLLPRRYRVAAYVIGFVLGAVIGTALGVESLLSAIVGALAFESATEFWWWHNRHHRMAASHTDATPHLDACPTGRD